MPVDTPGRPEQLESLFGASLLDGLHSLGGVVASVVYALLSAPDSFAAVRSDPTLVPAAFLEAARLHPAVSFTQRQTLDELLIDDVAVPAGTPVTMAWLLGNRDPDAFDDPNAFRLYRAQRAQTTFGGGLYVCPGRHIVRFVCETVLSAVAAPTVEIELAGVARWVPGTGLHELEHMPVTIRRVRR
jgi:cytochrome P450